MTEKYEYLVDPNDIGDIDIIPYQYLVFRLVGRKQRLDDLIRLKSPKIIIEQEKRLIQKAYNQMVAKCLKDNDYERLFGDIGNFEEDE